MINSLNSKIHAQILENIRHFNLLLFIHFLISFLQMDWLKKSGYAGVYVSELDYDDSHGACGNGKFPLTNIIAEALTGERMETDTCKLVAVKVFEFELKYNIRIVLH